MHVASISRRPGQRLLAWVLTPLVFSAALVALATPPAVAALPGEPTVEVTVAPSEVTIDASGINPVDTTFRVNVTGTNLGPRAHTMWVNLSFNTSSRWRVNPAIANLTLSLPAGGSANSSVPVTVTVPPGVSANNVTTFTASFWEENDLRFSQGDSGNRTAQVHIRQIFSTFAAFNASSQLTIKQGQDANYTVMVTNRGNGDVTYDAQLLNAADLRPNDVVVKSSTSAMVPQNGTGVVRLAVHANPAAIPGPYQIQIRVIATGLGASPPAGAYADLTGFLTVQSNAPPPPTGNNTTTPPPPVNNTTGNGNNPPPTTPSGAFSLGDFLASVVASPLKLGAAVVFALAALVALGFARHARKVKRARRAALEKARGRHALPPSAGARAAVPGRLGSPAQPAAANAAPPSPAGAVRSAEPVRPVRPVRREAGPK
jgi:hypothetical protein